ncbi:C40 family peptidase [Latilactobacillus sakei]|uniref:Peptidoglycan endopeptidase n=1 Tax=Latilactobacillus sakei TaxID=1599 RepID=A0AAX0V9A5_LATSK|nr:C40 family peptidase [Latilactobacillus sakei]ASN11987.1 cell surface protein [Latilactobacillus sakei]MCM1597780.1 NlpC/P60 family protein [Latilactobacillus sakei]PKX60503.1 peptidoglycan endopeptidase [Latilactobacillus sakei]PKX69327.1 peptidoglycan endopeptidase [Latilactobacillus sakei]PKX71121.1 peptidoglycan endopeptidase [Latilactobacillus sakei]
MNNTKSLIALGSGILGVAGISLLSASQANAATATVNYSAGATTVWTSPETGQAAKRYIFKGQSVNLLASQKVGAETWYRIGNGEWVPERYLTAAKETPKAQTDAAKTIRVAFADGATTVWATPTYTQPTGRYMTYSQTEGVVKTQTVSGEEWYQLANGGWVPARFTGEGQLKSTPVVKQAATPTQAPVQSTTAAKVVTPAAETATAESTSVATPAPVASSSVSESVASSTPASESTPVASESQAESVSAPAASSSVVESSSVSSESPAPVAESSVTSESTASAVESSVAPAQSSSATAVEVPAKETVESTPQATPIQAESATVSSTTPSTPVVESSTQQTTPKAPVQQSSVAESKPAVVESTKPTTPTQTTPTPAPTTPAPTTGNAQAVINLAMAQIGKPYVWGAHGPSSFDCSGLMDYVFQNAAGRSIGGWTVPQESAGYSVSLSSLQPGDLLFWGAQGSSYHVALYIGGGQYVHAPQPGENVKIGSMQYYTPSFAKRVF